MAMTRAAIGALLGAAVAAGVAFVARPFFDPPLGGVGFVTVNAYPKSWDYFVVAALTLGACAGAWTAGVSPADAQASRLRPRGQVIAPALVVFVLMLFIHDQPFAHMDPFHEGEHLTPAWLMLEGERPYEDVFLLHGLGADGGLDALAGARPLVTRRLQTVLDAATLALLVPIAAEVTATLWGMLAAVALSLCGAAALWVPVFPYYRLAPVLLAVLGLLRYARTGRAGPVFLAFASATLGVLWSLDTGTYALAGTAIAFALMSLRSAGFQPAATPASLPAGRLEGGVAAGWKPALRVVLIALALPFVVLLAARADIIRFLRDSFVLIPNAIDAVWSLPAPKVFSLAGLRYYLPPTFYGLLLALAWKRRDPRILIIAVLSIALFRTAAGRVSWSHTRFATPLLGIAFVAFVIEPLRNRIAMAVLAIGAVFYFEVPQNVVAGAKLAAAWPERQKHEGMVRALGIYTTPDNATQLLTLKSYLDSLGRGTILDFTNERALYFLLRRKPPVRCVDIPMLSADPLMIEASLQLQSNPPLAVILGGDPAVAVFDGVPNDVRVPELARWIDVTYPKRTQIGRFVVATR
jgi:hypothetical protein